MKSGTALTLIILWFSIGIIIGKRSNNKWKRKVIQLKCNKCGYPIIVHKNEIEQAIEDIKICPNCGEKNPYEKGLTKYGEEKEDKP